MNGSNAAPCLSKFGRTVLGLLGLSCGLAHAQTSVTDVPLFGAEVWIEPGEKPAEIDTWFRRLKEANMDVTRIRLTESYMRTPTGAWDFALFDEAFRAGEKYGIKIYGNLFPAAPPSDVGGFKFPRTEAHWQQIQEYVKAVVSHFRQFKSCYGWVPINEPGIARPPDEEFTQRRFQEWAKAQVGPQERSAVPAHLDFSGERFLVDYNGWYLRQLVAEIHRYDPHGLIHVNPHAIFDNIAGYDLRDWTSVLTSLGGSAHASWHFGYFRREQYAVAFSAESEILRSGAGKIPWFMTEIQGGNNTYSGNNPMCPTPAEISQWLWLTLATDGKGAMFWCLNPRRSGYEAGEWALLDFQNEPSERMRMAAAVAGTVQRDPALWANARLVESGISILYTRESLWVEARLQRAEGAAMEGRSRGGVVKSALAYFEALGEMGLQANLQEIDDYDFDRPSFAGQTIILSHQIALPARCWRKLETFVARGGKLIVDGLTGFYDENAVCLMTGTSPLDRVFGGRLKEVQCVGNLFEIRLLGVGGPDLLLPAHLWRSTIHLTTGRVAGTEGGQVTAIRNHFGAGEVVWVPSLIGLACRIKRDYRPLADFLAREIQGEAESPFHFAALQPGLLMKTLKSGGSYLTVIVNQSSRSAVVPLMGREATRAPKVLFPERDGAVAKSTVLVAPEETLVIQWI